MIETKRVTIPHTTINRVVDHRELFENNDLHAMRVIGFEGTDEELRKVRLPWPDLIERAAGIGYAEFMQVLNLYDCVIWTCAESSLIHYCTTHQREETQ